MRKLVGVGAGLLVGVMAMLGGTASAADATGNASWGGGYAGLLGGYGWGKDDATPGMGVGLEAQTEPKGWVAGAQAGFNWQFPNSTVFGVEGTLAATGLIDDTTFTYAPPPASVGTASVTQKVDKYGMFRARVGTAIGEVLPYIAGGVAFGMGTRSSAATGPCTPPNPPVCSNSINKTFTGWTAGAGAEFALGDHWSIRGEYSYLDFGKQNFAVAGPAGGTDVHLTASIVTGAINYRW